MIYPTIKDLSKDEYNRYEIALATAKCARMITNEYVRQRKKAEEVNAGNKESDKNIANMIDRELRDEKAVKIAIGRIHDGAYDIVHKDPEEQEKEERAILECLMQAQEAYYFSPEGFAAEDDEDEDDADLVDAEDEADAEDTEEMSVEEEA